MADDTDDPVVTAEIVTPAGALYVMAETEQQARVLVLRGFHMHGATIGSNEFGSANFLRLAQAVMEYLDVDEIQIEGAIRTSGANP